MAKGIPTIFKGVRFRSRLEARWAAFFDLAGWHWAYEPIDRNGWIPDFTLAGKKGITYVEVKPIQWLDVPMNELAAQAWDAADLKKVRDNPGAEALIVGADLPRDDTAGPILGVLFHEAFQMGGGDLAIIYRGYDTALDFCAYQGSFEYRIGGEYDGDHHLRQIEPREVRAMWATAGNMVQWHGPSRTIS